MDTSRAVQAAGATPVVRHALLRNPLTTGMNTEPQDGALQARVLYFAALHLKASNFALFLVFPRCYGRPVQALDVLTRLQNSGSA